MSYQKLEQAAGLFFKLQQLDKQIAEIEKVAMLAADGESEVNLSLSILSTVEMKNPEPDDTDEYFQGGIPKELMEHFERNGMAPPTIKYLKPQQVPKAFYNTLSDTVTLQILGMLMYEKNMLRKEIIEKIKELNLV